MDKYVNVFAKLCTDLKNGERFGLRMQMEGEGKFKYFQGEKDIEELKKFLENAEKMKGGELMIRPGIGEEVITEQ